jgi:hypothetical protein
LNYIAGDGDRLPDLVATISELRHCPTFAAPGVVVVLECPSRVKPCHGGDVCPPAVRGFTRKGSLLVARTQTPGAPWSTSSVNAADCINDVIENKKHLLVSDDRNEIGDRVLRSK